MVEQLIQIAPVGAVGDLGALRRLSLNNDSSLESRTPFKTWFGWWGAGCHLLGPIWISGAHLAPAVVAPPLPTEKVRVILEPLP